MGVSGFIGAFPFTTVNPVIFKEYHDEDIECQTDAIKKSLKFKLN